MTYTTSKIIKHNGYYGHQNHNGYLINDGFYTATDAYINALGDTTYSSWILPISNDCPVLQTMQGGPSEIRRVVSNIITLPIKPIEEWVGASFAGYVGTPIIGLRAVDVPTIPFPSTPTSTTSISVSGTNLIITSPVTQGWKLWIFSKTYVGGGYSTKHIDYPYLALQSTRINYSTETETVSIPTMINQYRADVVDYSTGTVLAYVEFQVGTPTPSLKWKCSGSPNYICSQASDGIYNNKVDCESICKIGATDKYYDCVDNICKEVVSGQYKNDPKCAGKCKKETKTEMGNTILIVLGAGIGLGVLYYITQKKK